MAILNTYKTWLAAARLRTLPLALSSIILGSLLARWQGKFSLWIMLLSMLTATLYQVLSNFANDLGDGLRGTDANRVGEKRAIATGTITIRAMKRAVTLFTALSIASGTLLSYLATRGLSPYVTLLFVALGLAATVAARSYTLGRRAYGYAGFGDVFVLIFFGWLGVLGSNFLQTAQFEPTLFLPATAVGLLAVGVLNLNNLRDVETDVVAGKRTMAVRLGRVKGKVYQTALLVGAIIAHSLFLFGHMPPLSAYMFLLVLPILLVNLVRTWAADSAAQFDPLLKPLAIATLLFCLLAGIGLNL
jgi:1,4-dihydroxy-2-naphthoate octaprenyltransferase